MAMEVLHAAPAVPANRKTGQGRHTAYVSFNTVDHCVPPKVTVYHSCRRGKAHKT